MSYLITGRQRGTMVQESTLGADGPGSTRGQAVLLSLLCTIFFGLFFLFLFKSCFPFGLFPFIVTAGSLPLCEVFAMSAFLGSSILIVAFFSCQY